MSKKIISYIVFGLSMFLFALLLFVSVTMMISRRNNDFAFVFNRAVSTIGSGSMEPELKVGDFIVIKDLDFDNYYDQVVANPDLHIGKDWIVYYNASEGRLIVHELYSIGESGYESLQTKGIANPTADTVFVDKDNFRGIVTSDFRLFGLGKVLGSNRAAIFLVVVGLLSIFVIKETREIYQIILEKNKEKVVAQKNAELEAFRVSEKERLLEEGIKDKES